MNLKLGLKIKYFFRMRKNIFFNLKNDQYHTYHKSRKTM